ncbi:MAG: hypothetical protein OXC40_01845 [Proteobacteria bacterium]|nr:hypothetical protein [Pseudomonadota bacterium]
MFRYLTILYALTCFGFITYTTQIFCQPSEPQDGKTQNFWRPQKNQRQHAAKNHGVTKILPKKSHQNQPGNPWRTSTLLRAEIPLSVNQNIHEGQTYHKTIQKKPTPKLDSSQVNSEQKKTQPLIWHQVELILKKAFEQGFGRIYFFGTPSPILEQTLLGLESERPKLIIKVLYPSPIIAADFLTKKSFDYLKHNSNRISLSFSRTKNYPVAVSHQVLPLRTKEDHLSHCAESSPFFMAVLIDRKIYRVYELNSLPKSVSYFRMTVHNNYPEQKQFLRDFLSCTSPQETYAHHVFTYSHRSANSRPDGVAIRLPKHVKWQTKNITSHVKQPSAQNQWALPKLPPPEKITELLPLEDFDKQPPNIKQEDDDHHLPAQNNPHSPPHHGEYLYR